MFPTVRVTEINFQRLIKREVDGVKERDAENRDRITCILLRLQISGAYLGTVRGTPRDQAHF